MIDKINNKGSYDFQGGSSTSKRKNPAVRAYENTPGFKEAARGKAADLKKEDESAKRADKGVVLDLSSSATAVKKKETSVSPGRRERMLAGTLRKLFAPVVRWLRDFWESDRTAQEAERQNTDSDLPAGDLPPGDLSPGDLPPLEELSSERFPLEDPQVSETDETSQDTRILQKAGETKDPAIWKKAADEALKSRDLSRIEQFVTKNGTKRLAHNSDLLTYYDRRGQFVEMDETEKHRVLYGDKNVLKL